MSYTRTVLSDEPDATRDPLGENTALLTQSERPSIVINWNLFILGMMNNAVSVAWL